MLILGQLLQHCTNIGSDLAQCEASMKGVADLCVSKLANAGKRFQCWANIGPVFAQCEVIMKAAEKPTYSLHWQGRCNTRPACTDERWCGDFRVPSKS